ncbi:MAG TPA: ATP-binding protein, partial [Rubricoccaceae bacterium]
VRALLADPEGSLWAGSSGGGLVRLRDGRFTPFGAPEGLGADGTLAVAADPAGGVWAATSGGGVAHIDSGRVVRRLTTADGLPSDDVSTVLATRDGAVWAGFSGAGLCRWDGPASGRTVCYGEADGLPVPFVLALFEDPAGTLWVGTDGGLVRWTGRAGGRAFEAPAEGAPQAPVVSFARTADGALWAGTFGDGLYRLADGQFTHHPGLDGEVVLALHAQADGTVWAGTYGSGLFRVRPDGRGGFEDRRLTTRDGLLSNSVLQVLEDRQDRLWLTSNRGIARLGLDALNRAAEAAGDSSAAPLVPVVYGRPDGLRSAEANGGVQPAGVATADGALWFPTTAGLATIQPAAIRANRVAPPVVVQRMNVNGAAVPLAGPPVVLAPGSRELAFEYAGLSFLAPGRVRHRYRLDGRDDGWTEAGPRRDAFYTDLAPGDYVFQVQAANDDGVWNRTGAAVAFTLRPHVWQTGWFAGLCVLAVVGLAAGAVRGRTRQLQARAAHLEGVVDERTAELRVAITEVQEQKAVIEEQAETLVRLDEAKTVFFNNVSHEFRTPLTLTIGPLENALDDAYGPVSSPLRRQMEMMLRNSRRLLRLINQLLDVAKLESGKMNLKARRQDLRVLLDMVTRSFEGFAEEHQQALVLEAPDHAVPLTFEADKLEKVFFNLLSNAIKYTPAGGTITVALDEAGPDETYPEGAVVVRVRDTGRGMEAEALPHIFDRFHQAAGPDSAVQASTGIGLSLVRELVELHAGVITVESTLGEGSTFVVTLPKGEAHLGPDDLDGEYVETEAAGAPTADAEAATLELSKVRADYRSRKDGDAAGYSNDGVATYGQGGALPDDAELVLLVEDNPDVRAYVRDCLADRYRIAEAPDGQAGLDAARRLRPDLVLSDVMMPVMDGYALCRALKADPDIGHTPLILLTAKADEGQRVVGLELGADDYMAKPFNARELRARVHNTLLIKRQERELAELNEDLRAKVCEQVESIFRQSRLQKYFPQKLVRQILDGDAEVTVGAGRKRVTVFFSDLTGFTALSDTTPPEVVTRLLNEYLTEMVKLIEDHGGTLDKFMGDGVMVLFGAADEMAPDVQARQAVAMAVAMQRVLVTLREKWAAEGLAHLVELRIGINQDEVTVGNFGSEDLVEYTAIGSGVNLASRLEGACQPGQVLVSLPVFALTRDWFA